MQPGPFNKNTQNQKFYNSIADAVMKINREAEEAKIENAPISELKMPQRDARGNVKNGKVRAAFAKGADNAQGASNRAMDKALGSKGNRPEIDSTINNIDKSIAADDRRDDRNRNARKEEVEFTDETYVAGEKYDKNKHIIQTRTHPHTGKPVNVLVSNEKGNQGKIVGKFMKVAEGKLVDRVMKKRKEMKNKGTIPGSDGY